MSEKKIYKIPKGYMSLVEKEFYWDTDDEQGNYNRIELLLHKLSLREIENIVFDLVLGQLMGEITVSTKEGKTDE